MKSLPALRVLIPQVQRWEDVNPEEMEEEVKGLFKQLEEVKVFDKCNAFLGMSEVMEKWMVFRDSF